MKLVQLLFVCAFIAGCTGTYLAAIAPNAWELSGRVPSKGDKPLLHENAEMLSVTNRNRVDNSSGYGDDRSSSMAFGHVTVEAANMSSQEYAGYMTGHANDNVRPICAHARIAEAVRFPGTPLAFAIDKGVLTRDRPAVAAYKHAGAQLRNELTRELAERGTGKVVLFVQGFNSSFEDSAINLFELWSAFGRAGFPPLFSWPVGGHKVLGYLGETQNGDFSVYHLKETLRLIAATEAVDEVVVIAHSHGASVVTSALRELLIESRGAGLSMRDTYRIETLILTAPDIDLGVMEQRLVAETFGIGLGQINVYLYPDDNALGVARWLFGSLRFGAARPEQMSRESRAVFQGVKPVYLILVQDAGEYDRHNYFRRHPVVLSDIAITIRTGARPADPERPLEHLDLNFQSIDKTYTPSCFGSSNRSGQ
ncbi:alpha/beta hydrolase [Hyphomonas sp.]|uniref:alpha/beta hydrolase n=1 Tax=Hyphomonas sp. TaxID=87 RepID=UPI00356295C2